MVGMGARVRFARVSVLFFAAVVLFLSSANAAEEVEVEFADTPLQSGRPYINFLQLAARRAVPKVSDHDLVEDSGCLGKPTGKGWEPACNFYTTIFATRSPLDGDTMYVVHLVFVALPGCILSTLAFAWVIRYEAKRRYCFPKLKRGKFEYEEPADDELIGPSQKKRISKEVALYLMLGSSTLAILLVGWNYASAIEYTRYSGSGACDINAALRNVSYTLDNANEGYERVNPNPAPKSNGTTGGNSPADVLSGLANTFEKGSIMTTQACPTGKAVSFAPFMYAVMSLIFLLVMVSGISGIAAGVCGNTDLLKNVGSISTISSASLFAMWTVFFLWTCQLADTCPVYKPYMTYQMTKGVKLGDLPEVQSEVLYLLSCEHTTLKENKTAGAEHSSVIAKYEQEWCGPDGAMSRIRQSLNEEQERTEKDPADKKQREEKIHFYQKDLLKYKSLCAGVANLRDCSYVNRAIDRGLKETCGKAFGFGQHAMSSSFLLGLICAAMAFSSYEKMKHEPKSNYGPLEYDQYGAEDEQDALLTEGADIL